MGANSPGTNRPSDISPRGSNDSSKAGTRIKAQKSLHLIGSTDPMI
jgi:hypothetical protein